MAGSQARPLHGAFGLVPWLSFFLLVISTFIIWRFASATASRHEQEYFIRLSSEGQASLLARVQSQERSLSQLSKLFLLTPHVSSQKLSDLTEALRLEEDHPGIRSVFWIERKNKTQVRGPAVQFLGPDTESASYLVEKWKLDLRDMTVLSSGEDLIFVYPAISDRRRPIGWMASVFRAEDFLNGALALSSLKFANTIRTRVIDLNSTATQRTILDTHRGPSVWTIESSILHHAEEIQMGTLRWRYETWGHPEVWGATNSSGPSIILTLGLLLCLILGVGMGLPRQLSLEWRVFWDSQRANLKARKLKDLDFSNVPPAPASSLKLSSLQSRPPVRFEELPAKRTRKRRV